MFWFYVLVWTEGQVTYSSRNLLINTTLGDDLAVVDESDLDLEVFAAEEVDV